MPNGALARFLERRRDAFYEFGDRGDGETIEERRIESAQRALFELEEVVLLVLIDAKLEGERVGASPAEYSLSPGQISDATGIFSQAEWGLNPDEIVCGILGKLMLAGLVAQHIESAGSEEVAKAYTVIDVTH